MSMPMEPARPKLQAEGHTNVDVEWNWKLGRSPWSVGQGHVDLSTKRVPEENQEQIRPGDNSMDSLSKP